MSNVRTANNNADQDWKEVAVAFIITSLLFNFIYIGVAINFYFHLTHIEDITIQNCTTKQTDVSSNILCENFIHWKKCGIVGIVVPGFIQLFFNLFLYFKMELNNDASSLVSSKIELLWQCYTFSTKIVSFIIFIVLWKTELRSISELFATHGLQTAAIMYMIVLGLDGAIIGILLLLGACICFRIICI